jgi:hypothetical protein
MVRRVNVGGDRTEVNDVRMFAQGIVAEWQASFRRSARVCYIGASGKKASVADPESD